MRLTWMSADWTGSAVSYCTWDASDQHVGPSFLKPPGPCLPIRIRTLNPPQTPDPMPRPPPLVFAHLQRQPHQDLHQRQLFLCSHTMLNSAALCFNCRTGTATCEKQANYLDLVIKGATIAPLVLQL